MRMAQSKTECGIHTVTEEVAGKFHRDPHSSDPLRYFNCLLLELISPMQLDRHSVVSDCICCCAAA